MRVAGFVVLAIAAAGCGRAIVSAPAPGLLDRATAFTASSGYRTLHSFSGPPDGLLPTTALVQINGTLYGTTRSGGTNGGSPCGDCGTVYSVTPSGTEKVIYRFTGYLGGAWPEGDLVAAFGVVYGTTLYGGKLGGPKCGHLSGTCGTVFIVTPDGKRTTLYAFTGGHDGAHPRGGLIRGGNNGFYGTTSDGGSGFGTVFSILTDGSEKLIYRFAGPPEDGNSPVGDLAELNRTLYGVTEKGGAHNMGTIFKVTIKGDEEVLHSFDGSDGAHPAGGLKAFNGILYGAATADGPHQHGVIFSISPGGGYHIVHAFHGSEHGDGSAPWSPPILVNGTFLYGTTHGGGGHGRGTIYRINPHGKETVVHSFGPLPDGDRPVASLFFQDGTLYGSTAHGGEHRIAGTVFSLTPP